MIKLDGLCFSVGREPHIVTPALITVARDAYAIRMYGNEPYYLEAIRNGLKIVPGAWLGEDASLHKIALDELIETAHTFRPRLVIVGNESLLFKRVSPETLIACLRYVKARVPKGTLVTTAEDAKLLLLHPEVMRECDVVGMHYYPFWHGVPIEHAHSDFDSMYRRIRVASSYKPTIILETGWPSDGGTHSWETPDGIRHSSVASMESAARYCSEMIAWSRRNGVVIFWFEAFNELWKIQFEGLPGAHWGIRESANSPRKYWPVELVVA
jgi:exo-beta-1,3-glucanase (GH17 family)